MFTLSDHRRFATTTSGLVLVLAALLASALLFTGRWRDAEGLGLGVLIGLMNVVLLTRAIGRLGSFVRFGSAKPLTVTLMVRFVTVVFALGVVMSTRQFAPAAVLAGLLLFPVSLVVVAMISGRPAKSRSYENAG